ncbi:PTS mannose/fructose/sorbose/N-acetylgalactosamine transporter subunit IIC [Amedibacillus sp. YH-ame10]
MDIQLWQVLLLSLLGFFGIYDDNNTKIGIFEPVVAGFIAGIIMGDAKIGLAVGGTLQLMILGVGTYGGASIPDYMTAAIISTAFAIAGGKGTEFALALAVPIGLLLMQLDIVARFANSFFEHRAEHYCEKRQYKGVELCNLAGMFSWGLSRFIPIFIALYFGSDLVQNLINIAPQWLMDGLGVAGGVLPALGIAVLLRYLPISNFYGYIIIGFVLASYLQIPMLGVALIGLALALIRYKQLGNSTNTTMQAQTTAGGFDEDE